MTISFILKRSKTGFSMDDTIGGATIYVRLRDGRLLDSTASTGETVNPLWWDAKREEIKANIICDNKDKAALNEKLQDLKKFLYTRHKVDKEKGKVTSPAVQKSNSFRDTFQKFLDANEFSTGRLNQYRVIERAVLRFEEFMKVTKVRRKNFSFDVRTVDENDLNDLYDFMSKELYGTPYYLTKEEMQKMLNTDLSATPEYERQRDVFIFHCCIGCRVGDLLRLKKSDVIDGAIEYIATKTIADNARNVRVPLNGTAL